MHKCAKCKIDLDDSDCYEYRGAYACDEHFDDVIKNRDIERKEIMQEEESKLRPLKGLDITNDNPIGRANREILKASIDICSNESARLKSYESDSSID